MKLGIIILIFCLNYFVTAANIFFGNGNFSSTAKFLEYDFLPQAVGLGGAYSCAVNDQNVVLYNPSSAAFVSKNSVFVEHIMYPDDIFTEYLSVSTKEIAKMNIVISMFYRFSYFDGYEKNNDNVGDILSKDYMAALSFSKIIFDGLSAGANIKFVRMSSYIYGANIFAFDVGLTVMNKKFKDIVLSLSARNIGFDLNNFFNGVKMVSDKLANDLTVLPSSLPFEIKAALFSNPPQLFLLQILLDYCIACITPFKSSNSFGVQRPGDSNPKL